MSRFGTPVVLSRDDFDPATRRIIDQDDQQEAKEQ